MGQITISLPDELDTQLRGHAEARGYSSISSLVAEALREKFAATQPLNYWSRVSLVVQLENQRLLEALVQKSDAFEQGDWPRDSILDALEYGYTQEYSRGFQYVDDDEMSSSDAKYVIDVLDMYADLQFAVNEVGDGEFSKRTIFPGFDGNHEGKYMSFVRYLRSNHRFAHVKCWSEDANSHGMGADYRTMLARYRSARSLEKDRLQPLPQDAVLDVLGRRVSDDR